MLTPLQIANVLLVFASTLFAMSVASGIVLFMVHSFLAVLLAGQLVSAATRPERRRIAIPLRGRGRRS